MPDNVCCASRPPKALRALSKPFGYSLNQKTATPSADARFLRKLSANYTVLREECGPANPFVFKPLELLDNPIFNTSRRHAYVEFEDREGARLSVILIADNSKDFEDARAAILGSGLFIEQPAQIISPEAALQFVNGSCDLPEPFHSVDNIDWDDGIRLLSALAMRGISPRKIAELTSVSLPKKRLEPPTKPRFVDDGVAGFTSPPDDKSSSWNW